jgi:hypoxanthine phosphoribosyltransferase
MDIQPKTNITEPSNSLADLRGRFRSEESNYQRLSGEVQAFRQRTGEWSTSYVQEKYVAETDKIIGILDGSIDTRDVIDPTNPERSGTTPDTVIWLDKSARPVSWFVDAFWEQFAVDGAVKPDYEFLNIDRENWFVKQGHDMFAAATRLGPSDFDIDKVPQKELAALRAIFTVGELTEDNWEEEVWSLRTRLDGQNILIVDEVKNKGGTLSIATQLLRKIIPDSVVSGSYFWKTGYYSPGRKSAESEDQQMESAPVWYDKNDDMGRGVGNISLKYREREYKRTPTQDNLKKKIGSFALSAPHHSSETYELVEDTLAHKLQQDIAYLSYAVADGKVLRTPHPDRPSDQVNAILQKQHLSLQQYSQYREHHSRNPKD